MNHRSEENVVKDEVVETANAPAYQPGWVGVLPERLTKITPNFKTDSYVQAIQIQKVTSFHDT